MSSAGDPAPLPAPSPPPPPGEVPAPGPSTPDVPEARKVSIPWRIPVGVIITLLLFAIFAGAPYFLIPFVEGYNIQVAANGYVLAAIGSVIAVFEGARYILKPTRLYGPCWIVASGSFLGYMLYLANAARVTLPPIHNVTLSFGYGTLLLLLAIVPALTLAAAIVTTVEDLRHPGERMPYDFPLGFWARRKKARAAAGK
jgi:hypothetical protein